MRYLVTITICFVVAWTVGAVMGVASFDPFDDDLLPWVIACAIYLGTPAGALLTIIALPIVRLTLRRPIARHAGHRVKTKKDGTEKPA